MKDLPKAYLAKDVEKKWYDFWERCGYFTPDLDSQKPPFCIVMPPPNVTGVLHMGHALVSTLQDIMIRWKRMKGFNVLWVPGTDHAGIATQTVVERNLIQTKNKRRTDFSKEEFISHIWSWVEKSSPQIIHQLKRLGCSCDWSRLCFTMDEKRSKAVKVIFKKLFDQGLIYRGNYLVNWDPVTQTALADDEVEYEEKESFLWHFKYPFADGSGFLQIATTRPETMLGDTAIAVSPKDARYQKIIGKTAVLPLLNRPLPIIADDYVDPEFGTGMVKITPAHDPNDYQVALRHNLPMINIMTPDGKINENGGQFAGLTMKAARDAVVIAMEKEGLLEKREPHLHRVGVSYRSKAVIEPYLSKQWFISMESFIPTLRNAVKESKVKLIPKNWENTYFHWINHLRDWCISRQLWWGHQIPIWYHKEDPEKIICFDGEGVPPEVAKDPNSWIQEQDVLDTWFSSALWPFSTLGWPEKTKEQAMFYPNSVLITGHDILFFWVARMIMMGEYVKEVPPFPETYLHGLIYGKSYWRDMDGGGISYVNMSERIDYDKGAPLPKDVHYRWEKMSKTKGNIIDPLEISEEYGTDAIRMALAASPSSSRQIDLDRRKFEEFRNFANKVWNGARFVFSHLEDLTQEEFAKGIDLESLQLEDKWILSKLITTVHQVNQHLENYAFDQAAMLAYDFFWKEFCAYFVEIAKPILFQKEGGKEERKIKQKLLVIILNQSLRLLHPMAPFITEELFSLLQNHFSGLSLSPNADPYTQDAVKALLSPALIVAPFPEVIRKQDQSPTIEKTFDLLNQILLTIRQIRAEMKIPPQTATDLYFTDQDSSPLLSLVSSHERIISSLVKTDKYQVVTENPKLGFASIGVFDTLKILIPLPQEFVKQEILRLEKEKEKLSQSLDRVNKQLSNQEFIKRAPNHLVEEQKALSSKLSQELNEISEKMKNFS